MSSTPTTGSPLPPEKKMLTLRSSDGVVFDVEEEALLKSQTIKNMIDDDCAGSTIPLPEVSSRTLAKVIEYCRRHKDDGKDKDGGEIKPYHNSYEADISDMAEWDRKFAKVDDQDLLFDLLLAANFLEIKDMLDLLTKTVADMLKGKSPEAIRKEFNIVNDFTPEEEQEIRKENAWAFE